MIGQAEARQEERPESRAAQVEGIYQEGLIAGVLGAAVIAVWFLILDTIAGRPFHTPTILGTAIFRRGEGLASPETLPVSFEMVLLYTWIHVLVFCVMGGVAARSSRSPSASLTPASGSS